MKTHFFQILGHPGRIVLTLLAVLVLAACSTQAPSLVPVSQVNVPVTGLASATAPASSAPAAAAGPTQPQAAASPAGAGVTLPTTPAASAAVCSSPAALTPAVTEGPYFKAGSPARANLLDSSITSVTLTLTGYVLTADCQPVPNTLLDFWQANAQGQYDNSGYTLRGHQYTDASGRFQLVTVIPGLYPGRTEHIHVKVQAPNGPILTTQLFFPGVVNNSSDGIYDPALLIAIQNSTSTTMQGSFTFVITK